MFFGSIAAGSPLRFVFFCFSLIFSSFSPTPSGALDQFLKWIWAYYYITRKYSSPLPSSLPPPPPSVLSPPHPSSLPSFSKSLPTPPPSLLSPSFSQSLPPPPGPSSSHPLALPSLSHLIQSPVASKRKVQSARFGERWNDGEAKEPWVCGVVCDRGS